MQQYNLVETTFKIMWWIYAMLSALFASITTILAKPGVANTHSNLATAIRTAIAFIMITLIVLVRNETKGISTISKTSLCFLIGSGIATGLSWIFYFKALQVGEVAKVAPVDKLSLALTIILAVIFLGETLSLKNAIGAFLILAGTFMMILK